MKNYFIKFMMILLVGVGFTACSDYLDVQPEDQFLEDQVYQTEAGINSVLNNIYLNLAKPSLYGGNLTMSTVELLAQRYNVPFETHTWYNIGHYLYDEANVKSSFDNIWTNAYTSILDINALIENLGKYNTLGESKENVVKGEAYGLRAMLHFDLLRLFGPIYSVSPENPSIPYYTKPTAQANPILPASEVMNKILKDLKTADSLLQDDPIIANGIAGDPSDPFYAHRNLRLNYYAVKALEARVNLYVGNTTEAYTAATAVINQASGVFPWTSPTDIVSAIDPDRVFSSEVIFGLQNLDLYNQYKALFSPNLRESSILAPNSSRLETAFENNQNDYRYNSTWIRPSDGSKNFRTFYKFADVINKNEAFRFLQPLIRISEMYYIAAETAPTKAEALTYLNTVRYNRGLTDLTTGANIEEELEKAYVKEFYGEGQLFFYYKRKNVTSIPDGSSSYSWDNISMGPEKYVIPLPDSETKFQ